MKIIETTILNSPRYLLAGDVLRFLRGTEVLATYTTPKDQKIDKLMLLEITPEDAEYGFSSGYCIIVGEI